MTREAGDQGKGAFGLQVGYDQAELLGARWWQESLLLQPASAARRVIGGAPVDESRRSALKALFVLGGGVIVAGTLFAGRCSRSRTWTETVMRDSLLVQREQGLAAGAAGEPFSWPHAVERDCQGQLLDRSRLAQLVAVLRPKSPPWSPTYVPTLFQVFADERSQGFVQHFRTIATPEMARAFAQGAAIRELLAAAEQLERWLLVIDLPGPESVAFAAGLEPYADAVFTFDNWPHPRGVVKSHLTLAAAVYYAPLFARDERRGAAALVLDRDRLAPYRDEPDRFDNRYAAKVPDASFLLARGVQHVFYVTPDGTTELDDLNERFVAWRAAGIALHPLSLADVVPAAAAPAPSSSGALAQPRYYWHGSPGHHWWFWNHYGWASQPSPVPAERPPAVRTSTLAPQRRQTMFDGVARLGQTRDTRPRSSGSSGGSWSRSSGGFGG